MRIMPDMFSHNFNTFGELKNYSCLSNGLPNGGSGANFGNQSQNAVLNQSKREIAFDKTAH